MSKLAAFIAQKDAVIARYAELGSTIDVAQEFGVQQYVVVVCLHCWGAPIRRKGGANRKPSERVSRRVSEVRTLLADGKKRLDIMQRFECSARQAEYLIQRAREG